MPELNIRALGELIHLPVYEHLRILAEQKYPRQVPAVFRVPFYGPSVAAIRRYYQLGNDLQVLADAEKQLEGSGYLQTRIDQNIAVLKQFAMGKQRLRAMTPVASSKHSMDLAGLGVRFRSDLSATEGDRRRYLLYNLRSVEPTPEVARTIVELAYHVVSANDVECSPKDFEFVSVRTDKSIRVSKVRSTTLTRARQSAKAILQLWPTI